MSSEWYPKLGKAKQQKTEDESNAYHDWIVRHLTEEEQIQCAKALKVEDHEKVREITQKGVERAGSAPAEAWRSFKEKYLRVEELRRKGRSRSDAESKEFWDLIEALNSRAREGRDN